MALIARRNILPKDTKEETIGILIAALVIARGDQDRSTEAEDILVAAMATMMTTNEGVKTMTPIATKIGEKNIVRTAETIETIGMMTEKLVTTTTTTSINVLTNTGRGMAVIATTVMATTDTMVKGTIIPITSKRSADEVDHVRPLAQREGA